MGQIDVTVPLLMLVGAFYTLAGVLAVRAVLSSRMLDLALAALDAGNPDRRETLQQVWLLVASLLILAGGVALLLHLKIAALLFAASALFQIVYLLIAAPYYFDAGDNAPDATGRAGSTNAAILYTVVTAFVLWAHSRGYLFDVAETPPLLISAAGAAVLGYAVYALWTYFRRVKLPANTFESDDES